MKLDAARLCLDCEEIHEAQICPICSSEAFAYLTRWVQPAVEREAARPPEQPVEVAVGTRRARTPEQIEAYRQLLEGKPERRRTGFVTGGVLGLAAVSLAGWALFRKRGEATAEAEANHPVAEPGGSGSGDR